MPRDVLRAHRFFSLAAEAATATTDFYGDSFGGGGGGGLIAISLAWMWLWATAAVRVLTPPGAAAVALVAYLGMRWCFAYHPGDGSAPPDGAL